MSRSRQAVRTSDPLKGVIEEYRAKLAEPAVVRSDYVWQPVRIGPTWQTTSDGFWLLPEHTLGWEVLGWCGVEMQHRLGKPWRFTLEQARFILWWYAIDGDGEFLFRDGVYQRLKGHGKDPVGAALCGVEMVGPCRFAGWGPDGQPMATDCPDAWVQTAAVSLEQTKNTMRLFPSLWTKEAKLRYRLQVGKEMIHGLDDERLIQAVTSSPATLEGARSTFVLLNETHHWLANNDGHEMAAVIERNATKSADGAARTLRITNAYEPSEDSVAQRDREAWESAESGSFADSGLLYDSLEAHPDAPLTAEAVPAVVESVRGDSVWLSTTRIVKSVLDPRNPPSRSRRFWYNQVVAAEDAWLTPQEVDATAAEHPLEVPPTDEVVLFFDGSKSDDSTGLVGCRISDGYVFTLGVWQKPPGDRGKGWIVPRAEVNVLVEEVFDDYTVVAFFADPGHMKDDADDSRFWDPIIDEWHRKYSSRLRVWAVRAGDNRHSVMWDMTSPDRVKVFTEAAMQFTSDATDRALTHDGHPVLKQHLRNARRAPNRFGVSLRKAHRESAAKIDLAVCAVGARMLRRLVLNTAAEQHQKEPERRRTGRVHGFA